MAKELDKAQVNHLRRLLGWIRCEIGQSPEELVDTVRFISSKVDIGDYGKEQMVKAHERASKVPIYIRAAIKSLEPLVRESHGEIVDPVVERKLRYSRKQLKQRGGKMLKGQRVITLKPE